jgi:hypothetical protein
LPVCNGTRFDFGSALSLEEGFSLAFAQDDRFLWSGFRRVVRMSIGGNFSIFVNILFIFVDL